MKRTLLIILILSFKLLVFGQENKFELGIGGGPGLSFMRTINNQNSNDKSSLILGYTIGIVTQYNFNSRFSICTNFSQERKGDSYETNSASVHNNQSNYEIQKRQFDYFTMPILLRVNFGEKVKNFVNIGPFFSNLNSYSSKIVSEKDWKNDTDLVSKFDKGITFGMGIYIPSSNQFSFIIELRNNFGIENIKHDYNIWVPTYTNSTNFLLGIAYKFRSSKNYIK